MRSLIYIDLLDEAAHVYCVIQEEPMAESFVKAVPSTEKWSGNLCTVRIAARIMDLDKQRLDEMDAETAEETAKHLADVAEYFESVEAVLLNAAKRLLEVQN
jgi:hypothetical protein